MKPIPQAASAHKQNIMFCTGAADPFNAHGDRRFWPVEVSAASHGLPLPAQALTAIRWALEDLPEAAAKHGADSPEYATWRDDALRRIRHHVLPVFRAALAAHSAFVAGDVLFPLPQEVPQELAGQAEQRAVTLAAADEQRVIRDDLV